MAKYAAILLIPFLTIYVSAYNQYDTTDIGTVSLETLLEQKIESASKYEQNKNEAPASVIIISAEEIHKYCNFTLGDIINKIRGFYTRNDRSYSYLGVRGFDRPSSYSNNILLLIDGHTYNENIYGQPYFSDEMALDVDLIERIEIVEGPGSTFYGTGAILSVINIITKKGKAYDNLALSAEAGSLGCFKGDISFGKEVARDVEVMVSARFSDTKGEDLYFKEYDSPENNNGVAEDMDWETIYGFYTKLTYKDLALTSSMYSRFKGVATASYDAIFNDDRYEIIDKRANVDLKYTPVLSSNVKMLLRGYYDFYRYHGTYPFFSLQKDGDTGGWLGTEAQLNWDLSDNNHFVTGIEYKNSFYADYFLKDEDTTYFDKNFPYQIYSVYGQDSWQLLDNLSVSAGLRYDHYSISGDAWSPKGALIYNPFGKCALKLLYASAYRAPNIYELYYEDETVSVSNHDLKQEKINSVELVWEQEIVPNINGSMSFYHYSIRDLIDQGSVLIDSNEFYQFQNRSEVNAWGFEFDINARFDFGLWSYFNFSHQIVKDENDLDLTNSPKFIVKTGFSQSLGETYIFGAELLFESERITVYNTETPSYYLVNCFLSYAPHFEPDNFLLNILENASISLRVNNLFDRDYKLPAGNECKQVGMVQYGRMISLKLEYKVL